MLLGKPAPSSRMVQVAKTLAGLTDSSRIDQNLYDGKLHFLLKSWHDRELIRMLVTVVSPNSYFSFTPFLASTTVGTLEYRCATEPVRALTGVHFSQSWAEEIGKFSIPTRSLPRRICVRVSIRM